MKYRYSNHAFEFFLPSLNLLFAGWMGLLMVASANASPPLNWVEPPGFDPKSPGLGLPQLEGVEHELLYVPKPSKASLEEGGNGHYESIFHGSYSHDPYVIVIGNKVLVYWLNHSNDENGPGQRVLGRWGVFDEKRDRIDWGKPEERTVELAPPPVLVHRRVPLEAEGFDRRYANATLDVVDGKIRVRGRLEMWHGWTDDVGFRFPIGKPIPEEHFRPVPDGDEHRPHGYVFRYDMRWNPGPNFVQLWKFSDEGLIPETPVYLTEKPLEFLQLTPTRKWPLRGLLPPYSEAALLKDAPESVRKLISRPADEAKSHPEYAPGTDHLAANGKNALAHRTEFRRADGTWVVVRDNLADRGSYFAAESHRGEPYPPAERTNFFGYAQPASGVLPDGRVWIIGNNPNRQDMYLTLSKDGKTFDKTWLVMHEGKERLPGFAKPQNSGAQYFKAIQMGESIWVFYSIGKEDMGVTRIPYSALK